MLWSSAQISQHLLLLSKLFMVCVAVSVCACVAAISHLRFISSVITGKPYQQISDLVITGRNWLRKKDHNTLSLYFLLLTSCPVLCCLFYRKIQLAPYLPLPPSSTSFSEHFPRDNQHSFLPFIFWVRHLENRLFLHLSPSHSIILMFIQFSNLPTFLLNSHLSSHWPLSLCSQRLHSLLLRHLSRSGIFPSSSSSLYLFYSIPLFAVALSMFPNASFIKLFVFAATVWRKCVI